MNEINQIQSTKIQLPKTESPLAISKSNPLSKSNALSKSNEDSSFPAAQTVGESGSDRVEVSAVGVALAQASVREAAALEASVRIEKVAKIRSDIQNGTYDIDGRLNLIVDDLITDVTKNAGIGRK